MIIRSSDVISTEPLVMVFTFSIFGFKLNHLAVTIMNSLLTMQQSSSYSTGLCLRFSEVLFR